MRYLAFFLIIALFVSAIPAIAETNYPPYDFLVSKGYTPERIDDSPGRKTINMMGGEGWWGVSFSDDADAWMLMALPEFNPTFKLSEFQQIFVEMVEKFDWDVSFYWPDYDSGSKITASYNIVEDIDQTAANYMDKSEYVSVLKNLFGMPGSTVPDVPASSAKNSRRTPALVGQPASIAASKRGLDYTMRVVVDEFYRGAEYVDFIGDCYKDGSPGCEYVAVKVTATFESIDHIQPAVLGTDDPEISVNAIVNFKTYSSSGAEYDNVHYSIYGMKELKGVYEGASTTGYFQFEIAKDDPAPILVYKPQYDQHLFFSLQ